MQEWFSLHCSYDVSYKGFNNHVVKFIAFGGEVLKYTII